MTSYQRIAVGAVVVAISLAAIAFVLLTTRDTESSEVSLSETLQEESMTSEETSTTQEKNTLFGTMLAFNTNEGLRGIQNGPERLMEGWSSILEDADETAAFITEMARVFQTNGALVAQTDFSSNRDVVGAFVWNVIEPTKGTYDWSVPDATLAAAGEAGVNVSAVVQPFASWDQSQTSADEYKKSCTAIDFGYYDFKAGEVTDWDAYQAFLAATVERYDGDGVDDMPGLVTRVEAWEIGNEIEGPCGGFGGNPEGYVELLQKSYEVIKETDSRAIVLNGGALEIFDVNGEEMEETVTFWETFFSLAGDRYLDIFNFHYNQERRGAEATPEDWESTMDFFNALMNDSDGLKPMWVTEFGTYSGTPGIPGRPGERPDTSRFLPTQSPEFQASWYFRYAVIGFARGIERIFVDLQGSDSAGIGASSLFNQGPGADGEARAFLSTLQMLGQEIGGFSAIKKLDDGQYQFEVDGKNIYALWDGTLPEALEGETLVMITLDGETFSRAAEDVAYSEEAPVLVQVE